MSNQTILYLNLFSIFYFLGLFVAMKVSIASSKPAKYLGYLILIPIFNLLNNTVIFSECISLVPYTVGISSIAALFFVVFLRAHIWAVLNKKVSFFSVSTIPCYLFGLVVLVHQIILFTNGQEAVDHFVYQMVHEFPAPIYELYNTLFYISQLIVFIDISIVVFSKLRQKNNSRQNLVKEAHLYSRRLLIFILLAYLFAVLMYFISTQFFAEYFYLPIAMNLFFFFVLFTFVKFNNNFWSPFETSDSSNGRAKKNMSITDKEKGILIQIEAFFKQDLPFLESGFNQRKLEDQTGIPIHQISAVINKEYKMNFSDYVNSFRIDFAKELLQNFDDKKEKIENIAYDAGFNSKASFYRAFKKHTSTTPKSFISNK